MPGVVVKVYEHHLIEAANGNVRAEEEEGNMGRGLVPLLEVEIGNNCVSVRDLGGRSDGNIFFFDTFVHLVLLCSFSFGREGKGNDIWTTRSGRRLPARARNCEC